MVDDIAPVDSTNNEDGVALTTLGIVLEGTEVYKTVGDCSIEEVLDTEVKISVVKLLRIFSKEDKRDDGPTNVEVVISAPLLDVETVRGEVNDTSLCGNGVDDMCLVVEGVGSKMVVSDWSDFMVLVTAYDDMLVTTFPWLL